MFGKTLSPDAFARKVIAALRRTGAQGPLRYDAEQFAVIMNEGAQPGTAYLNNAYAEYCQAPWHTRRCVLRRYAEFWTRLPEDLPSSFADARDRLLPQVRTRLWYDALQTTMEMRGNPEAIVPRQPLASHLAVAVVFDLPQQITTVNQEQLDDWGVTFDEALSVARDNLWRISNDQFLQVSPGTYVAPWGDCHDASRLFLHDLIWQLEVKGNHVAIAAHRDRLIITGDQDLQGMAQAAGIAQEVIEDSRVISGVPVRRQGAEWVTFHPKYGYAEVQPLRNLYVQSIALDYEQQQYMLEELHRHENSDVFVPEVMLVRNVDTDDLRSLAVWAENVESLLPKTDGVFLVREKDLGKKRPTDVSWKAVFDVVGDMMEPTDTYPIRYHVRSFPSAEQLERIQTLSNKDASP